MKGEAGLLVLKLGGPSHVSYPAPDRELCMAVGDLCWAAEQGGDKDLCHHGPSSPHWVGGFLLEWTGRKAR